MIYYGIKTYKDQHFGKIGLLNLKGESKQKTRPLGTLESICHWRGKNGKLHTTIRGHISNEAG